jgi:pyridoxamine 5'-phosphate oxidase
MARCFTGHRALVILRGDKKMLADPIAEMIAARVQARQLADPYVDVGFLATVTPEGQPEVRAIALRDIETQGMGLLINANSPKWQQLEATGQYALQVFWATVQRQYRVQGRLEAMESERLQYYWARKGYHSRLMEVYYEEVEPQSHRLSSRKAFLDGMQALGTRYPGREDISLPASLRGIYLYPLTIDVWHGSPADRLHHRRLFTRTATGWSSSVLVP